MRVATADASRFGRGGWAANSARDRGVRRGRTMPSRTSRDNLPSCSLSARNGFEPGDRATAIDNQNRRASLEAIDEGAEAVFRFGDAY